MANKLLTTGLRAIARLKDVTDWSTFLRESGLTLRPDSDGPVMVELRHNVERICARRIEAAKPKETTALEGGATMEIIRRDPAKPAPLTDFMHVGRDGRTRYYNLRMTKGWRRQSINEYEVNAFKKQGVKTLGTLPATSAFRADRRRA
jgi:hypothetical protein